ncbi:MAG: GtrA family protein [Clostridiales bacterium]|nr:GtrA family protein [Clostridiales bacterium]
MRLKKLVDITALKFILVGVVNTLVGTGVMFLLYNVFHTGYWIASASNYVVGSIVSYLLNKYFTFQHKERSWQVVVKFILNITLCYLIAYGLAKPAVRFIFQSFSHSVQENLAMLAGMGLFIILNYFGQRFLVFRKREEPPAE